MSPPVGAAAEFLTEPAELLELGEAQFRHALHAEEVAAEVLERDDPLAVVS